MPCPACNEMINIGAASPNALVMLSSQRHCQVIQDADDEDMETGGNKNGGDTGSNLILPNNKPCNDTIPFIDAPRTQSGWTWHVRDLHAALWTHMCNEVIDGDWIDEGVIVCKQEGCETYLTGMEN
ncbi:hypothetical protein ARMGADRAFT_1022991 [Armillaria gallica]|uniref:Uncharacterized protein n=1 Tax=Armillaria gallica TaxID=47427 RepID=A0A2H3EF80_ARMGA|nr:hypothetical protein ARMGADRAFT_1022991 [Armillaria gallica]